MKFSAAKLAGATSDHIFSRSSEECKKQLAFCSEEIFLHNVAVRLQDSESCGLVCLLIAADFLCEHKLSFSALLECAIEKGFSAKGEMFSASEIGVLAEKCFDLQSQVLENWCFEDIANHLQMGRGLVLVPYDCSKNFAPGMFGGEKSHWCVVVGFSMSQGTGIQFIGEQKQHKLQGSVSQFICIQPKSKRLAVWPAKDLKDSNENLRHCLEKKDELHKFDPNDLSELRGKIVLLTGKKVESE